MKTLLVNPWIHDFAAYDLWSKPLGLLKIAAFLKRCGVDVSFIDCLDRFHPELASWPAATKPKGHFYGCGHYYSQPLAKPRIYRHIPRQYKRYGLPLELVYRMIDRSPVPDIILVTSGMTYWYLGVFEMIRLLREKFKDVPIILGGIYARLCHKHALENSGYDDALLYEAPRHFERILGGILDKGIKANFYTPCAFYQFRAGAPHEKSRIYSAPCACPLF